MTCSIFQQLRAAALAFPSRQALADTTRALTYGEVAMRAEALGRHLAGRGVGPGHRVGVMVGRGVDLPTALFGVSAAGAAYVPLDPAYPRERLRTVIEDARISALVTDTGGWAFDGPVVRLPLVADAPSELARAELPAPLPQDPAYVIYTSGSTGRPKGVVVTNANVTAFFDALDVTYGAPADDRFLAVTSVSFDIALMELVWPLTRGGACAVAPAGMVNRLDPAGADNLPALMARFRPTLLQATPSLLSAITAYGESLRSMRGLRALTVGGEAFPPGLARRLLNALPGVRVVNMYGPTEATVWCSTHDVTADDARSESIPIGRPLRHALLRIVDENGLDVEPGTAGELWAGGPCVAGGYLGRPDLTRETFVVETGPEPRRWYRTGDRARARPDGVIEFIGRLDRQVKVSGVRIELDEIESALSTSPEVRAAAVVTRPGTDGRTTVVAYIERQNPRGPADR